MSYMFEDGQSDNLESAILSSRCFAAVIGHIFKENEGMIIELSYQEEYPGEPCGKFLVFLNDNKIKVSLVDNDDPEELRNAKNGQWFWLHDKPLQ